MQLQSYFSKTQPQVFSEDATPEWPIDPFHDYSLFYKADEREETCIGERDFGMTCIWAFQPILQKLCPTAAQVDLKGIPYVMNNTF